MFHQFKITSISIIVALAAVLILPVNAAASQLVSPTGTQVAQILNIDPSKMGREDKFQSLDREAVDAIKQKGDEVEARSSRECNHCVGEVFITF